LLSVLPPSSGIGIHVCSILVGKRSSSLVAGLVAGLSGRKSGPCDSAASELGIISLPAQSSSKSMVVLGEKKL
jgi:hypothetical protein